MKNPFRSIRIFWKETVTELKKASWPNRSELRESTIVVLIAVAILGSFITLADFSLMNWVEWITDSIRPASG